MNEREMFEKSFERPSNFFKLNGERQWEIDKELGILDWVGKRIYEKDIKRFNDYFGLPYEKYVLIKRNNNITKEKIWNIIKKHHLHHYGDADSAIEELDRLFNGDNILKTVEEAFDNNISSSVSETILGLGSEIEGKEDFLKEVKEKLDFSFCRDCGEKPEKCNCKIE